MSIPLDGGNYPILIREIDGEVVALDSDASLVHQLNASASLIWRLASKGRDAEHIVSDVMSRYLVDRDTAAKDVSAMLGQLKALNLLESN